ncbi:MAG: phosphoglycerate dehydrogenase [Pseudomonadota bacterium]
MMPTVLVTPRSLSLGRHPAIDRLVDNGFEIRCPTPGAVPSQEALLEALPGCDAWIAGIEPVSEEVIAAADRLKVVSRNGSGIDNLPVATLEARGIAVRRAVGANARGVSELALALTLAGLRHIVWTHEGMRQGEWPRRMGREIKGSRIGVVGLGAIGVDYAEACLGLGANVLGYDPFAPDNRIKHERFRRVPLEELVSDVDAISLHAPMPEDGKPLLTADRLSMLREGAVIVNTARAGLLDQQALLAGLENGQIACYATDVFEVEPPAMSPVLAHPNTMLTSHIGGFTGPSVERAAVQAVDNMLEVLATHAG